MERRKFLVGAGTAAVGGSALVGSGAFTRVESQRQVTIEVARDPDAYVGMDKCRTDNTESGLENPTGAAPNGSYVVDDGDGHLAIDMSSSNPTDAGGQGVNSDSHSWFDNVFQICNQGKQDAGVWLEVPDSVGTVPSGYDNSGEPRVQFYTVDSDGNRTYISGDGDVVDLPLGQCVCIGILTVTKELSDGDTLIDDEVVVHTDADLSS